MTMEQRRSAGQAWRAAAWGFLLPAVLLAVTLIRYRSERSSFDVADIAAVLGIIVTIALALVSIVCAVFGAVRAAEVNDRRFIVMLPMWASFLFLLVWIAILSAR